MSQVDEGGKVRHDKFQTRSEGQRTGGGDEDAWKKEGSGNEWMLDNVEDE